MRFATRTLLAALALGLWAGSASAQNDVTFQVNMQPFIDSCQFDPTGDPPADTVFVRGSFNNFDKSLPLTDDDDNGVFTGTASLAEGDIDYKFYTSNEAILGWENDAPPGGPNGNRDYTVVAGAQTIDVAQFNKPVSDNCGAEEKTYDLTFVVDMSTAIASGELDVDTETVAVAGSFTDWEGGAVALSPESDNPNVYSGTAEDVTLAAPGNYEFKFIIRTPDAGQSDGFADSYESPDAALSPLNNGNRIFAVSGDEDADGDGTLQATYDNDGDPSTFVRYGDAARLLTAAAEMTFVIDMRPAFYAFADSSRLPGGITDAADLDDVFVNGPLFGQSDGQTEDWATWSTDGLGEIRKLTYNTADSTASITLNYAADTPTVLTAKFSVGGADNESGFGGDKRVVLTEGTNTVNLVFGAQVQSDGTFLDDAGGFTFYDPYLQIDNQASPPTVAVVRRGGDNDVAVDVEDGPGIAGLEIGAAYPNPTRGRAALDLTLDRAMTLRVAVFDVVGRQVATLADGPVAAGPVTVEMDASALAPGVYLFRVEADGQAIVRRMTVLR